MTQPVPAAAGTAAAGMVPVGRLVRLTAIGALVGLPAGLLAFGFSWLVHEFTLLLWHHLPTAMGLPGPPWYLVIGLPVLGGLLVHLARQLPGDGGHPPIHEGLSLGGRPADALGAGAAALASLSFGLVLGPEAPLLTLGAAIAVRVTSRLTLDAASRKLVSAAGSAGALSTLFGGPLVAGLMILETSASAGLAMVPIILPALPSASVAYLLITGLGSWSGLGSPGIVVGDLPPYTSVLWGDLLLAVVAGVVIAGLAAGIRWLAQALAGLEPRVGRLPLLLGGGLVVGLSAWAAGLAGAAPLDVLFSGKTSVTPLLQATGGTVVALVVAKALGYAVSLGSGFRGGAIFPAVFLGVAVANTSVLAFGTSPTVAVAIGTAAGTAAMTRLLVSRCCSPACWSDGPGWRPSRWPPWRRSPRGWPRQRWTASAPRR